MSFCFLSVVMLTWMILGLWRIKEIYEQKNMHACIVALVVSDSVRPYEF